MDMKKMPKGYEIDMTTTNKKKSETTGKKSMKLSGHEQVVEYMDNLEHSLRNEIEEVR
jgi:hypothetical protein